VLLFVLVAIIAFLFIRVFGANASPMGGD
jgi:hypothetical protein